ncbi:hypothetical protein Scep_007694 [Stephania cephalantha]|uniref:Uncharacterized protein n=1 Tax=Stephania cephalantha TaxID=152367 RepID=A0AAP0KD27_9MAGN
MSHFWNSHPFMSVRGPSESNSCLDWSGCRLATGAMTSSHLSGRNEMCFIRGTVDIPHSRHSRYGDAASYDPSLLGVAATL